MREALKSVSIKNNEIRDYLHIRKQLYPTDGK
jgi:hypothetical protein